MDKLLTQLLREGRISMEQLIALLAAIFEYRDQYAKDPEEMLKKWGTQAYELLKEETK